MRINNAGLKALTVETEQKEIQMVHNYNPFKDYKCIECGLICGPVPLKLQYLKRSKQMMGFALWNVLSPVDGYITGPDAGVPTFSLDTLKQKGLI